MADLWLKNDVIVPSLNNLIDEELYWLNANDRQINILCNYEYVILESPLCIMLVSPMHTSATK